MRGRVSAARLAWRETFLCDLATTILQSLDLAVSNIGEETTTSWPTSGPHNNQQLMAW
jgi:hypothetical protein